MFLATEASDFHPWLEANADKKSDNGGNFVPRNSGITTNKVTLRGLETSGANWHRCKAEVGKLVAAMTVAAFAHSHPVFPCA